MRQRRWICAVRCYDDDRDWLEIELTKGAWAKVDRADLGLVLKYVWYLDAHGYVCANLYRQPTHSIRMNRLLMGLEVGDPRDVDHINHDTLDHRRENLRVCTHQQNGGNGRKHRDGSSRFKGVSWHRGTQKWRARINDRELGLFIDEEDAARAYDAAAVEVYGEYAHLNKGVDQIAQT